MFLPVLASLLVVFGAPYVGQVRGAIQSTIPEYYGLIIGTTIVAALGVAIITAVAAVRRPQSGAVPVRGVVPRLPVRYGLILSAVAIGSAYAGALYRWNPDVALVESCHLVEYGQIASRGDPTWSARPG